MIFADSSVWIDHYRNELTPQVLQLRDLIRRTSNPVVGDLVLVEVLQGYADHRRAKIVEFDLRSFQLVTVSDPDLAIQAAAHYRLLRAKGVTVRKTIDLLIATRCLADDYALLHRDRDFDPFVEHLGLRLAA